MKKRKIPWNEWPDYVPNKEQKQSQQVASDLMNENLKLWTLWLKFHFTVHHSFATRCYGEKASLHFSSRVLHIVIQILWFYMLAIVILIFCINSSTKRWILDKFRIKCVVNSKYIKIVAKSLILRLQPSSSH